MARPKYTEEKVGAMENQILSASLEILESEGYRALSLRALARKMDLTAPALYRYFKSKDDLIAELLSRTYEDLAIAIESALKEPIGTMEKVQLYMRRYLTKALEQPAQFRIMFLFDKSVMPDSVEKTLSASRERLYRGGFLIASEFIEANQLKISPVDLTHLWWVSHHGLVSLAVSHQFDMGRTGEQLIEPLIKMLTSREFLEQNNS